MVLRDCLTNQLHFLFLVSFQSIYYHCVGWPEKSLKGELALVTGGGGGLGRLLALRLVRLGCRVVLWDINQEGKSM